VSSAVFAMSAVLVTETVSAITIVPAVEFEFLEVTFPVSVIAPHVPPVLLKLTEAVPMFIVAVPSPNCMVLALPAA